MVFGAIVRNKDKDLLRYHLNKWRTGKFMEYLHLGRMVKPLPYQTDIMKMGFKWGDHIFEFPAVLSSAFTNEKETYQFFANYDNKIHAVSLEDKGQVYEKYEFNTVGDVMIRDYKNRVLGFMPIMG